MSSCCNRRVVSCDGRLVSFYGGTQAVYCGGTLMSFVVAGVLSRDKKDR